MKKFIRLTLLALVFSSAEGQVTIKIDKTTNATCGYNNGYILVEASGGVQPYSFNDNGGVSQSYGLFTGVAPGAHNIRVTDVNGASATTTITISNKFQHSNIYVGSVVQPTNCMPNGSVTFNLSGGGTAPFRYSADGSTFFTTPTIPNLGPGTYTFYVYDANNCAGSTAAYAIQGTCNLKEVPQYSASACGPTGFVHATPPTGGTAPYTYKIGATTNNTGLFDNLSPGSYTLFTTDKNNFSTQYTVLIHSQCQVNVALAGTTASHCSDNNGTITISSANGVAPLFTTVAGGNYQQGNTIKNLAPGSYTVQVKDATGNTGVLTGVVVGSNCPVLTVTSTQSACNARTGMVSVVSATGPAPLTFSINNGPFGPTRIFSNLGPGTYTVRSKDGANNILSSTATIQTFDPPSLATETQDAGCSVQNGQITATGSLGVAPYSFQVNNGAANISGIFPGLSPGDYQVKITDKNGCSAQGTATIGTTPGPALSLSATAASCTGTDGSIAADAGGGATPYQYTLDDGVETNATGTFSGLIGGNHTVSVKDANGCTASQSINIDVANSLQVDAGNDISICAGKTTVLKATGSTSSLTWSPAASLDNANSATPTASPTETTTYTVTATSGVCTADDDVTITVNPLPVANAGNDTTICFGTDAKLNGAGGISYSWSPSTDLDNDHIANPTVLKPNTNISYSLLVTDQNGCVSAEADEVRITVTPTPTVFAGNDTSVFISTPITLHAIDVSNSNFTQYLWAPPAGLDNAASPSPTATLTSDQTYVLTATTAAGCAATDSIKIKVYTKADLFVPNAFSPNGDGKNDILHVIPIGMREFHYFSVFNRWGQRVFYTANASFGWDGRINGLTQNTTGFIWQAEAIDYQGRLVRRTGNVVLIQ